MSIKPKIVYLTGVSGVGKTYIENMLRVHADFDSDKFSFVSMGTELLKCLKDGNFCPQNTTRDEISKYLTPELIDQFLPVIITRMDKIKVNIFVNHLISFSDEQYFKISLATHKLYAPKAYVVITAKPSEILDRIKMDTRNRKSKSSEDIRMEQEIIIGLARAFAICFDSEFLILQNYENQTIKTESLLKLLNQIAMSQERLAQIHASFNTPKNIISEIITKFENGKVLDLERIIAGEANEVYAITTTKNKFILRIDHRNYQSFEREKWAKQKALKLGVAVPKVLEIGFLQNNEQKYQYSLEEFVNGKIYGIYDTDKAILTPIFEQAGEILSKIHSIKLVGFGDLNEKHEGEYSSFVDKIDTEKLKNIANYQKIAVSRNLDWNLLEMAFEKLKNNLKVFENESSVLVHGDFNHKHFVVNGDLQIQAILDWGEVRAGSAVEDFGGWQFWFGDIFPITILTKKYTNKKYLADNFELKLEIYQIIKVLDLIFYYDEINDPNSFEFVMKKLKSVV